jgi:hypothetical protein
MFARSKVFLLFIPLLLILGSCSEEVTDLGETISGPDNLRATIDDSLLFWSYYSGDPHDVARISWDFKSDGILDFTWTNVNENPDSLFIMTQGVYSKSGDYAATLQITTVDNHLYRRITDVTITDQVPVIEITAWSDTVACGEEFLAGFFVSDDAGERVLADYDGHPGADISETYHDTISGSILISFNEPGLYPVHLTARDNDGNSTVETRMVVVGEVPFWEVGAPMNTPRTDHAAAVHDGLIYVFGGRHGRGTLASMEIYNPVTDSWSLAGDLPTPRWGLKAVTIDDDIYVIGGVTRVDTIFPQLEIYHPLTDTWTTFDPGNQQYVMPRAKRGFSALRIGDKYAGGDSLLVFGGMEAAVMSDTMLVYNMQTDTWSQDNAHYMRETEGWMGAAIAWTDDIKGILYCVGGTFNGASPSNQVTNYDPFSDYWVNDPPLITARIAPALGYTSGKLYCCGGMTGITGATDRVEVFSIEYDNWQEIAPMPQPRGGAVAVPLGDLIYVIGGSTGETSPYNIVGSADLQILSPWRCGD